jgi:hypothetical protein
MSRFAGRNRTWHFTNRQNKTLTEFLNPTGSQGQDIFESPNDLAALFASLNEHRAPVELILAGDFFDLLRIAEVPEGENRASATITRPEYAELFAALRRFAAGQDRRVIYLPGNHDAEAWWNRQIRAELERKASCTISRSPTRRRSSQRLTDSSTASTVTSSILQTLSLTSTTRSTRRWAITS